MRGALIVLPALRAQRASLKSRSDDAIVARASDSARRSVAKAGAPPGVTDPKMIRSGQCGAAQRLL